MCDSDYDLGRVLCYILNIPTFVDGNDEIPEAKIIIIITLTCLARLTKLKFCNTCVDFSLAFVHQINNLQSMTQGK